MCPVPQRAAEHIRVALWVKEICGQYGREGRGKEEGSGGKSIPSIDQRYARASANAALPSGYQEVRMR